jgi:hypothetical protein
MFAICRSLLGRHTRSTCKKPRRYREFEGDGARDQAGLLSVAQETADEHNRIELVLGEP